MNLVQRFEAWVNSAGTAADFLLKPSVGTGLDARTPSRALTPFSQQYPYSLSFSSGEGGLLIKLHRGLGFRPLGF